FLVALSALACSPAIEPPAKGSAHYSIDYPDSDLGICGIVSVAGIGDGEGNVPELPSGVSPPEDFGVEVQNGQSIEGGTGNYVVQCRVAGESAFDISVEMEGPNHSSQAGFEVGTTSIQITGTIGSDGEGTGSVAYQTARGGSGSSREALCTLSAVPSNEGGFQIGEGYARFTFHCPHTVRSRDDLGVCEANGTVHIRD